MEDDLQRLALGDETWRAGADTSMKLSGLRIFILIETWGF